MINWLIDWFLHDKNTGLKSFNIFRPLNFVNNMKDVVGSGYSPWNTFTFTFTLLLRNNLLYRACCPWKKLQRVAQKS